MYLAIVFLPLLGAVIAGVITLVGARNRLPGEDPPPPHDDHAATLVREGKITQKLAESRSSTPEELRRLLGAESLVAA